MGVPPPSVRPRDSGRTGTPYGAPVANRPVLRQRQATGADVPPSERSGAGGAGPAPGRRLGVRRGLLAGFCLAVAAGAGAVATTRSAAQVSGLRGVLGAYVGASDPAGVQRFDQQIGTTTAWAMDFLDGTSWSTIDDPSWYLSNWRGSGYHMVWAVPMLPCRSEHACARSRFTLAEGARGTFDHYFATLARRLVAGGQGGAVIRLGWEFNGNWFPWEVTDTAQARSFVAYWRHIVDAMRSVPGSSFRFEWNPMIGTPVWHAVDPTLAYPGNAYVDYVGLDAYDQTSCIDSPPGQCASAAGRWQWFLTEPHGLRWAAAFAQRHHERLALPEWGLWPKSARGGGDDPYYVTHLLSWARSNHVAIATYFDHGADGISAYPAALAAFRRAVGAPTTPGGAPVSTAP